MFGAAEGREEQTTDVEVPAKSNLKQLCVAHIIISLYLQTTTTLKVAQDQGKREGKRAQEKERVATERSGKSAGANVEVAADL